MATCSQNPMLFYQLTFFTLANAWLEYIERCLVTPVGPIGRRSDRGLSFREARRILQVTEDASPEVIRAAYKALALKHHPDRGGSAEMMGRVNAAYGRLTR